VRHTLRDHSDDSSFNIVPVWASIGLMIINATDTIVASAALSNKTPIRTTTVNSTANTKIVVAIDIRKVLDQIPVLIPRMIQTPSTRYTMLHDMTRTLPRYRP